MARKSCALLGPGRGPRVQVGTHGTLVVKGLGDDEFVLATLWPFVDRSEDLVLPIHRDGAYPFDATPFIEVNYEGRNKRFVATVLIGG